MHGAYFLIIVFPLYSVLAFFTNELALKNPTHHDVIHLYSEWADEMILILIAIYFFFMLVSRPDYSLLCKRVALAFALKGITQFLTIVPQPNGVEPCRGVSFWEFRNCADMMFSGHTCITYLVLYKTRWRGFLTFSMAYELVFADWHYMADCFVAVIVGFAIEQYLKAEGSESG